MRVFVRDTNRKPLDPCHPAKTGDIVRAMVPKGKQQGTHIGRIAVRATGFFRIEKADGISHRYCRVLHHADGYKYAY